MSDEDYVREFDQCDSITWAVQFEKSQDQLHLFVFVALFDVVCFRCPSASKMMGALLLLNYVLKKLNKDKNKAKIEQIDVIYR